MHPEPDHAKTISCAPLKVSLPRNGRPISMGLAATMRLTFARCGLASSAPGNGKLSRRGPGRCPDDRHAGRAPCRGRPGYGGRPLQALAADWRGGGWGWCTWPSRPRPIRRKVALKIIKPGMDTREVIARFEAERQALALMDHPNIARVFDAGATGAGRPFFVMELVRGGTHHRLLRPEQSPRPRAAGAVRDCLPCRAARASEGDHPP